MARVLARNSHNVSQGKVRITAVDAAVRTMRAAFLPGMTFQSRRNDRLLARERDADDAREHDRRARESRRQPSLTEPQAPDERREQNRELARGDDVAHL